MANTYPQKKSYAKKSDGFKVQSHRQKKSNKSVGNTSNSTADIHNTSNAFDLLSEDTVSDTSPSLSLSSDTIPKPPPIPKCITTYHSTFVNLPLIFNTETDNEWNIEVEKFNQMLDVQCIDLQLKPIFGWENHISIDVKLNPIEPVIDPTKLLLPHLIAFVRTPIAGVDEAIVIKVMRTVADFWSTYNSLNTKNMQFLNP